MCQYYYVYSVTNLVNDKIYIGKHMTNNLDDGYMGSGLALTNAIKKYGIENFRKQIIKMFDSENDALKFEEAIVTEDFIKDPKT